MDHSLLSFIARNNGYILWSFGNYIYEIEFPSGLKHKFEAEFEEAEKKFNRVSNVGNTEAYIKACRA